MKFIRWLGAYGRPMPLASDYVTSIHWEVSQQERHISVEPLWRGRSILPDSHIGLELNEKASVFVSGYLVDMYTEIQANGTLIPDTFYHGTSPRFRNLHRYLAAWNREIRPYHGEAIFASPVFRALVVKKGSIPHITGMGKRIAETVRLPLRVL